LGGVELYFFTNKRYSSFSFPVPDVKPWSGIQNLFPSLPTFLGKGGSSDMPAGTDVSHPRLPSCSTGSSDREVDAFAISLLQQVQQRSEVQIFAKEVTTTNTQLLHEITAENSNIPGIQPSSKHVENHQRFVSYDINSPTGSGTPNIFHCPNCSKMYHYKSSLARHIRLECGKEPQFQCPYCPHVTKHKSSLVMHIDARHRVAKLNV
jgi:uncharacterized C2H2 Zn-finger protein